MDDFDFTEDEIQEQLERLGYYNVPHDRLREFKKDLEDLVKFEKSRNSSWTTVESSNPSNDDYSYNHRPTKHNALGNQRQQNGFTHGYHDGQGLSDMNDKRLRVPKSSRADPHIYIHPAGIGNSYSQSLYPGEDDSKPEDTTLDTTASTDRKVIKRKVLRKVDGKSQVFDESSVTESDLDEIEKRLRVVPLSEGEMERPRTAPSGQRRRLGWNDQPPGGEDRRPQTARSAQTEPCYRLPDNYFGPKALIRPMTTHPHERDVKKHDPVSKYQQYSQSWKSHKAPGEKMHKNLRWNVREQMLYHDEVVEKKQRKVYLPNNYKIPSDKKRKNVRWHIRMDLAQGVVPPSLYD